MLGREVEFALEAARIPYTSTDREIDITVSAEVHAASREIRPRCIINCAAYTAVDRAESEEASAYAVNCAGALHLAHAAKSAAATLVHVSTDYVFSGKQEGAYAEDAGVDPIGAYGRTKASGEQAIRSALDEHLIVRTSWLHGPHGRNFVGTILQLLGERQELQVVSDQVGCPTYARDLAEALVALVDQGCVDFGVYHFANRGACTWHEFACEIQREALATGMLTREVPVHPVSTASYPRPAARPTNSVLATDRLQKVLAWPIPSWQDGLSRHLWRLRQERGANA